MAKINPSKFEKIEFTPEEEASAKIFQGLNLMYLKARRADYAEAKLALKFDPTDIQRFLQEEAELQGRIGLLNELIGD